MTGGKLVLVLGAGASQEFGLPTGKELKARIKGTLAPSSRGYGSQRFLDSEFDQEFGRYVSAGRASGEIGPYYDAARIISENMDWAPSIDNFLDTHRSNPHVVKLGKLAIAFHILKGEEGSSLFVDPSNSRNSLDSDKSRETWVSFLFSKLVEGATLEDFQARLRTITFVSFNYDRCVQQFFWWACRKYFDLSGVDARRVIEESLDVRYIYGTVGEFFWESEGGSSFGRLDRLPVAADSIRLFTEGRSNQVESGLAEVLRSARAVCFLGFGFLGSNISALFSGERFEVGGIYGTSKGLSNSSTEIVKSRLGSILLRRMRGDFVDRFPNERIFLMDKKCHDFLHEFDRALFE